MNTWEKYWIDRGWNISLFGYVLFILMVGLCMLSYERDSEVAYGKELIVDLYGCDAGKFTRASIRAFWLRLCELTKMQPEDFHFWDYEGFPEEKAAAPVHLVGTSGIQFITTSNITIHTIDLVEECLINLFTCKEFRRHEAQAFMVNWFKAKRVDSVCILRGRASKCETDIVDKSCTTCRKHGKCSGPRCIVEPCENHT